MAVSAHEQKTLGFYAALMNEVRVRLRFIETLHRGDFRDTIPATLGRETCFLQLRMVFEVVALGILSLHQHTYNIKHLERQWSANEIMPRISEINPNCFPHAVVIDGNYINDVEPQPLTQASFLSLYGRCGAELHRGTLRKVSAVIGPLVEGAPSSPVEFRDVADINERLWKWLVIHRLSSADLSTHYIGFLEYQTDRAAIFTTDTVLLREEKPAS